MYEDDWFANEGDSFDEGHFSDYGDEDGELGGEVSMLVCSGGALPGLVCMCCTWG